MRAVLVAFLFTAFASASAQNPSVSLPSACGPKDASFDVRLDTSQHSLTQPEQGKGQIYFIQDKGPQPFGIGGTVVSTIGIDGAWVGGNRNNSYFSMLAEPGEHHVCASVRSNMGDPIELAQFIAEPGKVYYFRERIVLTSYGLHLFLDPVDSDEANYLIASYPLSVSHPRK